MAQGLGGAFYPLQRDFLLAFPRWPLPGEGFAEFPPTTTGPGEPLNPQFIHPLHLAGWSAQQPPNLYLQWICSPGLLRLDLFCVLVLVFFFYFNFFSSWELKQGLGNLGLFNPSPPSPTGRRSGKG